MITPENENMVSNTGHLDKDAHPTGSSSPKRQPVSKDVLVIDGREFTFNRQGWARFSRDLLINKEGYKRKLYQHERASWNAQERFQKEKSNRQTLASTRGHATQARNQNRTTHLRMIHQQSAQLRAGQTHVQDRSERKRPRPPSGETPATAGKKLAKGGQSIFCPPTAQPSEEEEMEEDLSPEGREYWAQYGVRAHTCRIFATNDKRLDDVDISYLSQMMVKKRDKDFPDINDPAVLAESDKISVDRIGKSGKHIRLRLMTNDGIDWWRNFVNSVPPIKAGSAERGHGYLFFAPGESMWTYFRVWVADGEVAHPETGQALLEREVTRGNPLLREVAWKVQVVGADGGKVVAKLALPSASAYSLVSSMEYRLRYGMDRLEIVPTTGVSVSSVVAPGPGVPKDGPPGGEGEAPPIGEPPSGETPREEPSSGETHWRKKEELLSSSRESAYSDLETSTDTIIPNEVASKMLDTDMEEDKEKNDDVFTDPEVEKQKKL